MDLAEFEQVYAEEIERLQESLELCALHKTMESLLPDVDVYD